MEYILYDRDKAAFINKMNALLKQLPKPSQLSQDDFIDIPGSGSDDACIFVTTVPQEVALLDMLMKRKAFSYKIKKVNLKDMVSSLTGSPSLNESSKPKGRPRKSTK